MECNFATQLRVECEYTMDTTIHLKVGGKELPDGTVRESFIEKGVIFPTPNQVWDLTGTGIEKDPEALLDFLDL